MRRTLALTTLLALTLATARVRADDDVPAAPPATEEPAHDPVSDEARARIRRGLELYDEGDFRLALIELERAYQILPSYKILYNLGQVHFQLGEHARAHAALTRSTDWTAFEARCYPDGTCDPHTLFFEAAAPGAASARLARVSIMPLGGAIMTRRDWN